MVEKKNLAGQRGQRRGTQTKCFTIFLIFFFLFFGAWPLGLQVSAIISLGVFSPRPSLICGPLECGLLSVILGGIWVKDFGGHIESLYIKSLYSCSRLHLDNKLLGFLP